MSETSKGDAGVEAAAATTKRFREAGEAGDLDGILATLAPDATLRSPITMTADFRGTDELRRLFEAVFQTISDIDYFEDIGDAETRALFYRGRIGSQPLEETLLVRLDGEARIRELTIFVRPLPGLTAMLDGLGPKLARHQGGGRSAVVAGMTKPLALITRSTDKLGVRLTGLGKKK